MTEFDLSEWESLPGQGPVGEGTARFLHRNGVGPDDAARFARVGIGEPETMALLSRAGVDVGAVEELVAAGVDPLWAPVMRAVGWVGR